MFLNKMCGSMFQEKPFHAQAEHPLVLNLIVLNSDNISISFVLREGATTDFFESWETINWYQFLCIDHIS